MTTTLSKPHLIDRLRQQSITSTELLPLLANYRLIPQLLGESIVDQAIAPFQCNSVETEQVCHAFYQQQGLTSESEWENWRSHYGFSQEQVISMATRSLRLEKFIEATWGPRLQTYFLEHKHKLDQVVYSLIRVSDQPVATELYFRIEGGEQSFAELAKHYSEGQEAETGGRLGPFEFGSLHPELARLLYVTPIGVVQPPTVLGDMAAILRVEQRIPAQFDDAMRHRLLQEQFNRWLKEQLNQLNQLDQGWMGSHG